MKLVLGLGKTGFSIARFISVQNIDYKIADSRTNPPLLSKYTNEFLKSSPTLGAWTLDLLTGVDEIFISPGIAQNESIVIWAKKQNIPIVSDIELFSRFAKAPIIGITGSNGKSTVTQLLTQMIADAGIQVAMGGNIGTPALDCLNDKIEYYVLELSSYQLDYSHHLNLIAGVVLNITPDHLDRYQSFKHYTNSKLSLHQHCQHLVINLDEPLAPKKANAKHFGISIPEQADDFGTVTCHDTYYLLKGDDILMSINEAQLIGEHNTRNILAALALGDQIKLPITSMIQSIKNFKGLEHRLEWVAKKQNIDYYNDSKATNAISTITAIQALMHKHQNIVLILGGIAKQEDYTLLFKLINKSITNVVLIGQSIQQFEQEINTNTNHAKTMQEAVNIARSMINNGAILLSPGCASFDMFDNFEQRGQEFKEIVKIKY
ncbi:UDP-N-acetylmuramoylalanine--D-glutamate ligase [Abyssogena phaseoliformis symbiont OG214]|uniref:UDP-N-acetylmuramoyl-L-alanine--D-glutamate ligase n=1 Tax=Abyssogena phaseoliformis symbiont TaxID=596095 RepID=UPI00191578DA|nr:UDP-N-acetylmuramoyl-L-alanine--D-glutamate ligase [Abyssogena phaseoliformis symbiont]MBW5289977.1 UDP-N-acetylmuramoylalanine--D-glutamate ligase [Candidatus Ruthia sp. Apha_13_S6]BBB22898.1 UDP-N-acetylmuramoylalanine--D-glutamate ligase [Abyssogena phaseoliformis symbiont OG214]